MSFFKEDTYRNADGSTSTSTNWVSSISSGGGGAVGFGLFVAAYAFVLLFGVLSLLWFAYSGYKRYYLSKKEEVYFRIIAIFIFISYITLIIIAMSNGDKNNNLDFLTRLLFLYGPVILFHFTAFGFGKFPITNFINETGIFGKIFKYIIYPIFKIVKWLTFTIVFLGVVVGLAFGYELLLTRTAFMGPVEINYSTLGKINSKTFPKEYEQNIETMYEALKFKKSLYFKDLTGIDIFGAYKGRKSLWCHNLSSIEMMEALKRLEKEDRALSSQFECVLTDDNLEAIIDNLEYRDGGYSNKLAKLIKQNYYRSNHYLNAKSKSIMKKLKKYNQISALREYKRKNSR